MKLGQNQTGLVAITIFLCLIVGTSRAEEEKAGNIYFPCEPFTEGNKWIYSTFGPQFSSISENTVLSRHNGKIILGSKIEYIHKMPGSAELKSISKIKFTYIEENGNVSMLAMEIDLGEIKGKTLYSPPRPICGYIPSKWVVTQNMKSNMQKMKMIEVASIKLLGKENLTVKAGTFNTTVIEMKTTMEEGQSNGMKWPPTKNIITMYYAEGVGIVKIIIVSESQIYVFPEKSKRESSRGDVGIEFKKVKNIITTELLSYTVK